MNIVALVAYLVIAVIVARRAARDIYHTMYQPNTGDWVVSSLAGLLAGALWPVFVAARLIIGRRPS